VNAPLDSAGLQLADLLYVLAVLGVCIGVAALVISWSALVAYRASRRSARVRVRVPRS